MDKMSLKLCPVWAELRGLQDEDFIEVFNQFQGWYTEQIDQLWQHDFSVEDITAFFNQWLEYAEAVIKEGFQGECAQYNYNVFITVEEYDLL